MDIQLRTLVLIGVGFVASCSSTPKRVDGPVGAPASTALNAGGGATGAAASPATAPASTAPTSTAPATNATPTATPPTATNGPPTDAAGRPISHALVAQGYRPTTYRGQLLYCRYEKLTGSSFSHKVCLTEQEAALQERIAQDEMMKRNSAGKCLPPLCGKQ